MFKNSHRINILGHQISECKVLFTKTDVDKSNFMLAKDHGKIDMPPSFLL